MIYKGLVLEDLTDDEVLFFIRIRGKKSYFSQVYSEKIIKIFRNIYEYRCISEYEKDAYIHINLNTVERTYLFREEYEDFSKYFNMEEIISRCRGLRSIPYIEAKELVYRAYHFFNSFYSQNSLLKLIVCGTIDNYIMDIMVTLGEKKFGIKFFAITDSFMSPEYKLCTVRGEVNYIGNCNKDEIDLFKKKILNSINNPKRIEFLKIFRRTLYYFSSSWYKYFVRYIFKYKILGRLEYEYRFAPYMNLCSTWDQLKGAFYLSKKINFQRIKQKKAYIPLHFYPEATTDYWIKSLYDVDYLTSVIDTIKKLQNLGFKVIVKEHPHYFLSRKSQFYKKLLENDIILLSPFISVKYIFDNVDIVVVWNGSTGIESMIYNKNTVKVTNSYYGDGNLINLSDLNIGTNENHFDIDKCIETVYKTSIRTF